MLFFQNSIQEAFTKKFHVLANFFDFNKAFDTTWTSKILAVLDKWNIKGRIANFIKNFLSELKF